MNILDNKKKIVSFAVIYLFFCLFFANFVLGEEVGITITKTGLAKAKICANEFVPTEKSDTNLSNKLSKTLLSDLTLVDYFQPVDSQSEAELLLRCSYALSGSDQLVIEGKLYETKKGQMIFGKKFSGTATQHRKLIHSLTDSIVKAAFGENGIAQTRLTFEGKINKIKQICVSDYDGANTVQLTKDACPSLLPTLSPDGNNILYTSYLNIVPQTFIYNLEAGTRNKISSYPGLNTSAAFSPNGNKIALTLSKDGNPEIYIINIDGSGLTRVTNDKSVDTAPCWSPDGTKIAFVSNRGGTPQVYTISTKGGISKRITYNGNYNTNPNWSPKGNIIVYNSLIGGVFQICTVDVNTGQSEQITQSGNSCENPSFAPDGRHIVFSMAKGYNNELYLMDIFFRQPHKLEIKGNYTSPDWGR
jgi:TolB protein